jgi:hypothetical protein
MNRTNFVVKMAKFAVKWACVSLKMKRELECFDGKGRGRTSETKGKGTCVYTKLEKLKD